MSISHATPWWILSRWVFVYERQQWLWRFWWDVSIVYGGVKWCFKITPKGLWLFDSLKMYFTSIILNKSIKLRRFKLNLFNNEGVIPWFYNFSLSKMLPWYTFNRNWYFRNAQALLNFFQTMALNGLSDYTDAVLCMSFFNLVEICHFCFWTRTACH